MQEIITDVNYAQSAISSMSKQLKTATIRMSTASKEIIIEYANTNSDILKECIGQYQWVAEQADKHAADEKMIK